MNDYNFPWQSLKWHFVHPSLPRHSNAGFIGRRAIRDTSDGAPKSLSVFHVLSFLLLPTNLSHFHPSPRPAPDQENMLALISLMQMAILVPNLHCKAVITYIMALLKEIFIM